MKSDEELLDDYMDKYNALKKKNECWRMRVTPEEFLVEVEKIRAENRAARAAGYLNEYAIQQNSNAQISILLMEKMTYEEVKAQIERHKKYAEKQFAEEAPQIKAYAKTLFAPLLSDELRNIYRWLLRKQIGLEDMASEVQTAFKQSKFYDTYQKRRKE